MSVKLTARILPRGFRYAGMHCGIKKSSRFDLGWIVADEPCASAGVFTTNLIKAAPVQLSQAHIRRAASRMRAVVVNSGNANCATGPDGMQASRDTAMAAARLLGCRAEQVLICSTGVIGVPLPVDRIVGALPRLLPRLARDSASYESLAKSILTTDTRLKCAAASCRIGGRSVRLLGCAKGSGMIHPQMATMLAFIITDAAVPAGILQRALREVTVRTFNVVTVDGDTSTNDTVLAFANAASGARPIRGASGTDYRSFVAALETVCRELALAIVDDGEGASHLVEIEVRGAASDSDADRVAMTIAHSPLVKTAVTGADPNWGRILAAAGRSGAKFDPERVEVWFGGVRMYGRPRTGGPSRPLPFDEASAHQRLLSKHVEIAVDLKKGHGNARAWTCDLTARYVEINASYRS
ncbi:MAG: bifunctional glutamate N-acetyltransferase/amino-acid acetyltransferase ArgJ [Candidatus Acidiferrales bacterium]